jgi:hypothetical protein
MDKSRGGRRDYLSFRSNLLRYLNLENTLIRNSRTSLPLITKADAGEDERGMYCYSASPSLPPHEHIVISFAFADQVAHGRWRAATSGAVGT